MRIGDAYLYESMVGAPNTTAIDSKEVDPEDVANIVFPSFYVINCVVLLPTYYLILKFNTNKLCLVALAMASILYATMFTSSSIFKESENSQLVETIIGECAYAVVYALEPSFFAYAFYAVQRAQPDSKNVEDKASKYSRFVYTAAQGIACLVAYGILSLQSLRDYLLLWKIYLGFTVVALAVVLWLPSTKREVGKGYEDYTVLKIVAVYSKGSLGLSIACIGLHFSNLIVIGYVGYLWYGHPEYQTKSTALNGIVFAMSWISGSIFTVLSETKLMKNGISMLVQLGAYVLLPYLFTVSMNAGSIWAPYSLYVVYIGVSQSLLGVLYARIFAELARVDKDSYFTAVYGINMWIGFVLCSLILLLPFAFEGYSNGDNATWYVTSAITLVSATTYLILQQIQKPAKLETIGL